MNNIERDYLIEVICNRGGLRIIGVKELPQYTAYEFLKECSNHVNSILAKKIWGKDVCEKITEYINS